MIAIELSKQEIADIAKCLNLPVIQRLWDKEQAERIEKLAVFFNELMEVDDESEGDEQ